VDLLEPDLNGSVELVGPPWNQSSRCQQIASIPERKDFTWSERVSLGEELEEVPKPLAKDRPLRGIHRAKLLVAPGRKALLTGRASESLAGATAVAPNSTGVHPQTADQLAEVFGTSRVSLTITPRTRPTDPRPPCQCRKRSRCST